MTGYGHGTASDYYATRISNVYSLRHRLVCTILLAYGVNKSAKENTKTPAIVERVVVPP